MTTTTTKLVNSAGLEGPEHQMARRKDSYGLMVFLLEKWKERFGPYTYEQEDDAMWLIAHAVRDTYEGGISHHDWCVDATRALRGTFADGHPTQARATAASSTEA